MVILNSATPQSEKSRELADQLSERYEVPVMLASCQRMSEEDFEELFALLINQFPACEIQFRLPGYMDAIPPEHWIKATIIARVKEWMAGFETIGQVLASCAMIADGRVLREVRVVKADMASGLIVLEPRLDPALYYKVIAELMDAPVENDRQLFGLLKEYASAKASYDNIKDALEQAWRADYGIVAPKLSEMVLQKPEVFKQGNKYGVRMKATAPCLHIIRTDISTEVSPLVGSESQSEDLARSLREQFEAGGEDIWETNLFGKSLREMVTEQMESKLSDVPEALRGKVQRSLQKISDEGRIIYLHHYLIKTGLLFAKLLIIAVWKRKKSAFGQRACLLVSLLTSFITTFLGSALNLSVPSIGREFAVSASFVSWIATVYMLTCALLAIPVGLLADRVSRTLILRAGIGVFAVSALGAAFAGGMWLLLALRAVQGVGAAMIFATNIAILTSVFAAEKRGRVLGYTVCANYLGLAAGPVLGGLFAHYLGWRAIFIAAAVVSGAAFFAALKKLPTAEKNVAGGIRKNRRGRLGSSVITPHLSALLWRR